MGSYVLGGALQGLGKGVDAGYDAYHQAALEKIRQAAEDKKTTADQAIKLANIGYRPLSDVEQATMSAPPPPKMTMLDPESRAGLSQNGIAIDNHDGSMTVPDGRPTQVSSFGGNQYAFDPSRMIDLKGGIAEAQYAPKATAQVHNIQARGDIQKLIAGDRNLTQRDIASGHDTTKLTTTGMNVDQRTAASKLSSQTKKEIHNTPGADKFTAVQAVDANGQPIVERMSRNTGDITPTGANGRPVRSAGTGGAAGAMNDVRLQVAGEQIQQADERMQKFEDGVLNNTGSLNPAGVKLARQAIAGSTTAETLLNSTYPALASYLRDAKQIATAERLISPRGGSNAMTQAEAMLAAAGASASKEQIANARQYRKSLSHALAGHRQGSGPPPATQPTDQQQHYDAAAAVLKKQGIDPVSKLGPRP